MHDSAAPRVDIRGTRRERRGQPLRHPPRLSGRALDRRTPIGRALLTAHQDPFACRSSVRLENPFVLLIKQRPDGLAWIPGFGDCSPKIALQVRGRRHARQPLLVTPQFGIEAVEKLNPPVTRGLDEARDLCAGASHVLDVKETHDAPRQRPVLGYAVGEPFEWHDARLEACLPSDVREALRVQPPLRHIGLTDRDEDTAHVACEPRERGHQRGGRIAKRQAAGRACLTEAVKDRSPCQPAQARVDVPLDEAVPLARWDEICSNWWREDRRRRGDEFDLVWIEAERARERCRTLGLERLAHLCVERRPEALRRACYALDRGRREHPRGCRHERVRPGSLRTVDPRDACKCLTQSNGHGVGRELAGGDRERRTHWTAVTVAMMGGDSSLSSSI